MNRTFFHALTRERPIILDGATGTELFKRGLPPGVAPEKWIMENPAIIQDLHREYFEAGSDIVLACTFGANSLKLADHDLAGKVSEMNLRLVEISRKIVPEGHFLFGDISPTGQLIEPFGPYPFEDAVQVYREQAKALLDGGVDGFMIETMIDIQEARAALIAVREVAPDMPIISGMTYDRLGMTLSGTKPEAALVTLQSLGADAVGCDCSTGPDEMIVLLERMLPYAKVPLFIKPNAGMPCMQDGHEHYDLSPDDFAGSLLHGVSMGARIIGGCCGTSPAHIRAVRERLEKDISNFSLPLKSQRLVVSSPRELAEFSGDAGKVEPLLVIGERINPTGKKAFQAELLAGDFSRIMTFAEEQAAAGASLLDVNLGLGGIDEAAAMRQAVAMLSPAIRLPLVIDTVDPEAMEAALRLYPGRALVNSVSGEKERLVSILPLAAKYGAAIIILPVGDGFIPVTAAERIKIIDDIFAEAQKYDMTTADVIVDGLAMTVSADPTAGQNALKTIAECNRKGFLTVLGLSNVSFGMPERKWLNAMFLGMGMVAGLRAVIANPSSEMLMEAKYSADALLNRQDGTVKFVERFAKKEGAASEPMKTAAMAKEGTPGEQAAQAILKGYVKQAGGLARKAVVSGIAAGALVSDYLVPAIMKAGELYERNEYYLPQLMLTGEAMRLAMAEIEPDLAAERLAGTSAAIRGKVIMATVKGDVHDIGKNLVSLMLRNHGFEVFDLGKDVAPEKIIRETLANKADIIGLSALMTTTLAAMSKTIKAARAAGIKAKIMVGGAAVTGHFATEAGADGFSADAVSAVKLAVKLMEGAKMTRNVVESMRERLYRRDPVFSFEFFPPKDEKGRETLEKSLAELAQLNPAFVSVTCGAAGSTRDLTRDLVLSMQERYNFGVMAHITAMGYSRNELADLVADYRRRGITNFLALRGDPPRDMPDWQPPADQATNATEVVKIIRSVAPDVSIGVAGYPEKHPDAMSLAEDIRHLGEKVAAGADFVMTQLFFKNDSYFNFVHSARRSGIKVPILPGIMPVTRPGQAERFKELCQVLVPPELERLLADEDAVRTGNAGVSYAAAQCADLLRQGAYGIHFYTLNQSRACHTLYKILKAMGW